MFALQLTNEVFHHLGVVSMKDGCGKPAQVELDIPLSCFNVFLVADVHRLSPVSRQRDANQTCRCEQQLSTLRQTVLLRGKY